MRWFVQRNGLACGIQDADHHPVDFSIESNARLAAAAPEMYELLKLAEPVVLALLDARTIGELRGLHARLPELLSRLAPR